MAQIIKHTICVYLLNPESAVYKKHYPRLAVTRLLNSISQPHEVRKIWGKVTRTGTIDIKLLPPFTRDVNVVIIPSRVFHFDIMTHSGTIILVVALDSGNPEYSHGIYCQALTLVRRFLGGEPVSARKGTMFRRMKPEGRAIILASMVDIAPDTTFEELYKLASTIKLTKSQKFALMNIVTLKKKLYALYKGAVNE